MALRFPVDVTRQTRCPVCKTAGPAATPGAESASLAFAVYATTPGAPRPVVLGGDLFFGWDAGVSASPKSRTTLGAVVPVARTEAQAPNDGALQMRFCSTACMRQFLLAALDELDRRAAAVEPKVRAARQRASRRAPD